MSTEFSAFAPPSLDGAPAAPSLPSPTIAAPTLPGAGAIPQLPSLPTAAGAPAASIPAPSSPSEALLSSSLLPVDEQDGSGPTSQSFGLTAGLIALVIGACALVAYGFVSMSPTDTAEPTPPPADEAATSPLVIPIENARDVVADFNDNSGEVELLNELGLDATGNPLAHAEQTPAAAAAAAGHRFTWSYGTGDASTVTVDSTTGNFSFESTTGTQYRLVDGTSFVRAGVAASWSQVDGDALETIQRLGLEQPITVDSIVADIESIAAIATTRSDDGTTLVSISIDDMEFATAMPDVRIAWLAEMGVPNSDAVLDGAFITADAAVAPDGQTIDQLVVTAGPWTSTYQLDQVFDIAPVIEAP